MTQHSGSAGSVLTVADVAARVRAHPWLAAVPIMLGVSAAVGYLVVTPASYTAVAGVRVEPVVTNNYDAVNLANVINMATELEVVQSSSVADRAAQALGTTRNKVLAAMSASSPQETQILKIYFSAATPAAAAEGANVVAKAYTSYRYDATHQDAEALLTSLGPQITRTRATLVTKNGYSAALADSYRQMLSTQLALENLRSVRGATQVTVAGAPKAPSSPKPLMALPSGLAGGLLVGLSLAVLWPQRRRRPARQAPAVAQPPAEQPVQQPAPELEVVDEPVATAVADDVLPARARLLSRGARVLRTDLGPGRSRPGPVRLDSTDRRG